MLRKWPLRTLLSMLWVHLLGGVLVLKFVIILWQLFKRIMHKVLVIIGHVVLVWTSLLRLSLPIRLYFQLLWRGFCVGWVAMLIDLSRLIIIVLFMMLLFLLSLLYSLAFFFFLLPYFVFIPLVLVLLFGAISWSVDTISRCWRMNVGELFEIVEHWLYHGLLLIKLASHDLNITLFVLEHIFGLLVVSVQILHLFIKLVHHFQLPLFFSKQFVKSSFPEFFGVWIPLIKLVIQLLFLHPELNVEVLLLHSQLL